MNVPTWPSAEANKHGFLSFRFLEREAAERPLEIFVRDYPTPALLVIDKEKVSTGIRELLAPLNRGIQLLTESIDSQAILRYLNKVAFIAKRPGNPYAHLVSIGRSPTNDITLAVGTVSKVHGYFTVDDDVWSFVDHGSTNGSRLNRKKLKRGQKVALKDSDVLQLGPEALLQFLTPAGLYRRAGGG